LDANESHRVESEFPDVPFDGSLCNAPTKHELLFGIERSVNLRLYMLFHTGINVAATDSDILTAVGLERQNQEQRQQGEQGEQGHYGIDRVLVIHNQPQCLVRSNQ
jgi:hypothetical protein